MYAQILRKATHTRRFTITLAGASGWEAREEQDSELVRRVHYTDWHRVERARRDFIREANLLRAGGWVEA